MIELTLQADPGCMDDSDPESLAVDIALENIKSLITPVSDTETVALTAALGRILAEDLVATVNMPVSASSAMDGYAVRSTDIPQQGLRQLNMVGTSWAGRPYDSTVEAGSCVRIMTGAILPDGTDTIVIQENVQVIDKVVTIDTRTHKGENVRAPAENYAKGDLLLGKGTCLYPAELGLIASLGRDEVTVTRKIRVAYFSTGDELRAAGQPLDKGCIYDSNRYTLFGMLSRLGIESIDMGIVNDDRDAIEKALLVAAEADAVIVSGGVSVGDADFTRDILEKTGTLTFWKIAIKPGRPLVFGRIKNAWFFGLPGNPVSTMVSFYQFVQPALQWLMGTSISEAVMMRVVCTSNLKKRAGRLEYQRGILQRNNEGEYTVSKTGEQGSGILTSMTQANCFIVLPVENDGVMAGDTVEVQPFFGLM